MTDPVPDWAPDLDDGRTAPFWSAAEAGRVDLPACPVCGQWQWYPLEGLTCHPDASAEWRTVPGEGRVFTFTRVERGFLPRGGTPPYTVAFVELDGVPGVRLVTVLVGAGSDDPAIGDRVRLAPTRLETHTLPTFELVGP
jgi:uncharacterized OB-fold protein